VGSLSGAIALTIFLRRALTSGESETIVTGNTPTWFKMVFRPTPGTGVPVLDGGLFPENAGLTR
jgi:hypothetical protein